MAGTLGEARSGTDENDSELGYPFWVFCIPIAVLLASVLRLAWISDDGFITARYWSNVATGHGLVLNWGQRVQAFTSPLHALLGIPVFLLVREPYFALLITNFLGLIVFLFLLVRGLRGRPWNLALATLVCVSSTSIATFATSGLENSLGYALVTGFVFSRRSSATIANYLWAGAVILCRHDLGLLVLPTLAFDLYRAPRSTLRAALPGLSLPILWSLFSLVYYGFLFPNTAYAKLNLSVPRGLIFSQGIAYAFDLIQRDLPLALVFGFGVVALASRRIGAESRVMLVGVYLYLGYLLFIGGDFMSGRFFTVPGVMLIVLVAKDLALDARTARVAAVALSVLALPVLRPQEPYVPGKACGFAINGITDERACYFEHTNLAENLTSPKWRTHGYLNDYKKAVDREKSKVVLFHLVGMAAYAKVPHKHILETWALSEPLLARLTFVASHFRPGHFPRAVPRGYAESLREGKNLIVNPCIHRLYDNLKIVTEGSLLASGRFSAIVSLNLKNRTCPVED